MASNNLTDAFRATARAQGDRIALHFEGQRYSHADLDRLSDQFAARLATLGVQLGDRVGVYLTNGPALILAHLAIGKLGAIRLCVNPAYKTGELQFILEDAEPRVVLVDPENQQTYADTGYPAPSIVPGAQRDPYGTSPAAPIAVAIDADTPALMAYTSGTTGKPKGALLTHGNLLSNISSLATLWQWTATDKLLLALPMFHMHGLGLGLHGTLLVGSEMILHRHFEAGPVLQALSADRCSMFMGVPTMYQRLVSQESEVDLSQMRLFISGSAPLPPEIWTRFDERWGHRILERYGLTETVMNASNPFDGPRKPGSVGLPLPGVQVKLDPPEEGEICVRGPNVFREYWNRPEATENVFDDEGYFRTGDMGRFDEDGYLTICSRIKELIISGGYNVYPREVEECVETHPSVTECAVVGLPDTQWGERVTAFVVLTEHTDPEALKLHVKERLVAYKVPKEFRVLDALPRNAMGKLMKAALKT